MFSRPLLTLCSFLSDVTLTQFYLWLFCILSCDALCKLLLHAVATGDSRFEEILVQDEEIGDNRGKVQNSKASWQIVIESQKNYIRPTFLKHCSNVIYFQLGSENLCDVKTFFSLHISG